MFTEDILSSYESASSMMRVILYTDMDTDQTDGLLSLLISPILDTPGFTLVSS